MVVWRSARLLSALALSAIAAFAFAQSPKAEFQPEVGQSGKDVVWVPSPQQLVDKMLDMAKVTPKDFVMDLGSGDGRTVITAAKRGASALGVEYNPDMVALSKRNADKAGVGGKANFVEADIFKTDLTKATVITMFLLTDLNLRLRPTILTLSQGPASFPTPSGWGLGAGPDRRARVRYLLHGLPVDRAGARRGKLAQRAGRAGSHAGLPEISGTLKSGNVSAPISRGNLNGDQISFAAGGAEYRGRVNGNAIDGTVKSDGKSSAWKATR